MKTFLKTGLTPIAVTVLVLIVLPAVSRSALLLMLVPFAGIFSAVKDAFGGNKERKRILETGEPATAVVRTLQQTGNSITYGGANVHYGAELLLEIQPASGAAFEVKTVHYIPVLEIPQFQPGAVLAVKYDKADKTKVAVVGPVAQAPSQTGAEVIVQIPPGQDPAQAQEMIMRSESLSQELLVVGEAAPAQILKAEDTQIRYGVNPFYKIELEVQPKHGPPFHAETNAFIAFQSLSKFQTGSTVWIKFDPNDKTRVTLVPSSLWDKMG